MGTTSQKKKKTSLTKNGTNQPISKDAKKKPLKQAAAQVAEVVSKNVTVTKNKVKDDDDSDEITDIVESLVSGGDDDSAENDDEDNENDDDDEEDSKETPEVTEGILSDSPF